MLSKNRTEVTSTLEERANELVQFVVQEKSELIPDYEQDPWLSQLNWTLKQAKLKKMELYLKSSLFNRIS